jgi:hypothetical protein
MSTSTVETAKRSFGLNRTSNWPKDFRLSRGQIKEIEQIIDGHYDELKRLERTLSRLK